MGRTVRDAVPAGGGGGPAARGRHAGSHIRDGREYRRVDLGAVTEPYEFTVETEWGWNTVRVEPGAICVTDADCPGHDCVQQGAISNGMIPIVCLPHRLVIQIEE